jgi:hypothetical protein
MDEVASPLLRGKGRTARMKRQWTTEELVEQWPVEPGDEICCRRLDELLDDGGEGCAFLRLRGE